MKDIHEEIIELGEKLNSREEVQRLIELEKRLKEDEEVLKLAHDFSLAQSEYNSCLNHYDFESKEASVYQKKLYEAKLTLDSHPLVKEYNDCLIKVNEPLRYLEYNLLSKLNSSYKCKK